MCLWFFFLKSHFSIAFVYLTASTVSSWGTSMIHQCAEMSCYSKLQVI